MFLRLLDDVLPPGSNLPESSGDATWMFLLPDLAPVHAWCVGALSDHVIDRVRDAAGRLTIGDHLPGTSPVVALQVPVDLLVVTGQALLEHAHDAERLEALRAALSDDACLAVVVGDAPAAQLLAALGGIVELPDVRYRLRRDVDDAEPDARAPSVDAGASFLTVPPYRPANASPRLYRRLRRGTALAASRVTQALGRTDPLPSARVHASDLRPLRPRQSQRIDPGDTLIVGRGGGAGDIGGADHLPGWVRAIGADAGLDWDGARWSFAPARGYRSQKPVFLIDGRSVHEPSYVVKLTQEPRFNPRLANEADALQRLRRDGLVDPDTIPEVVAVAEPAGLLAVVETRWPGDAFRDHSTATPDCPIAASAIDWFTELGVRSARDDVPADRLIQGARGLVNRYVEVFGVDRSRRAQLERYVAELEGHTAPSVYLHGDPGNWNLLARADGTIGVMDWENARPGGPPGWDLLLFLRTYGVFVAEAAGHRYTAKTFAAQFRPGSSMRPLIDRSLTEYARRVGVSHTVLETCSLLCWIHEALSDASRLPPAGRAGSPNHQLVVRCLEEPRLLALPEIRHPQATDRVL